MRCLESDLRYMRVCLHRARAKRRCLLTFPLVPQNISLSAASTKKLKHYCSLPTAAKCAARCGEARAANALAPAVTGSSMSAAVDLLAPGRKGWHIVAVW